MDDLREVIPYKPEVLVIGCGASGVLSVPQETRDALEKKGIKLIAQNTDKAVETFNTLCSEGKKIVGGFHLTC